MYISCIHTILQSCAGVYLSLKGVVYANNSVIPITEIGETNNTSNTGLQCITDRSPCCLTQPNRFGEWYFPDGMTTVPGPQQYPTTFSRTRGDDGTVNLNRINDVMMPTGLFCCVVPDATSTDTNTCINIGEKNKFITDATGVMQRICVNIGIIELACRSPYAIVTLRY